MTHILKILPEYFEAVARYEKQFELRKNDRDFQVNDVVVLREWDGERFTGRETARTIRYIYHGTGEYGLAEGYCILGLVY